MLHFWQIEANTKLLPENIDESTVMEVCLTNYLIQYNRAKRGGEPSRAEMSQLHHVPSSAGGVHGAREFAGRVIPPPLSESGGPLDEPALLIRFESRNTTTTVMSSWKCRRTPRSIFLRSEYLISRFFAASCSAAFTSLRALPCRISWHIYK